MAVSPKAVQIGRNERSGSGGSTLVDAVKTASRLVPRQITDEIELAKLELGQKKDKLGGLAVFAVLALVFLILLVVALVVAAIAGLAVVVPLWLSALIVCAALLVLLGIAALVAFRKVRSLLPALPENAWRGIRHDLGVAKEGSAFDASTLVAPKLTAAQKKAKKAAKEAKAAAAKAERESKAAEQGPKASQQELVARTAARRKHLLEVRGELLAEANVKKQASHLADFAREKAGDKVRSQATGALSHGVETAKTRWKPLAAFAVSAVACAVLLRKLFKK
jgi:uncharacterized membrane protein YqjE